MISLSARGIPPLRSPVLAGLLLLGSIVMLIVYLARNKVNGKYYIGQTVKLLKRRRQEHESAARNGSNFLFCRALRKYGFDSFEWKIIMVCEDKDDLNESEIALIASMKTKRPNGYNLTDGGEGQLGAQIGNKNACGKRSKETRDKISKSNVGNKNACGKRSAEARIKMSKAHIGKKLSKETKIKIGKAHTGKIVTKETRDKISKSNRGRGSVLNEDMVNEARIRARAGEVVKTIAEEMGCPYDALISAVSGRNWKHLSEPPVMHFTKNTKCREKNK